MRYNQGMNFESSQPDKRREARFRDQHGRVWGGTISIQTGRPIGPLSPVGWSAPLDPPQQYFKFSHLSDEFRIDYRAWIADRESAKQDYEERILKYAQSLYGEQAGTMLKRRPAELMRQVGDPPAPTEPIVAAAAGNKWILGLSDNQPKWAEKYFPTEEQQVRSRPITQLSDEDFEQFADQYPDVEPEIEEEEVTA